MLRRAALLARLQAPRRATATAPHLLPPCRCITTPASSPSSPTTHISPQALLGHYASSPTRTVTFDDLQQYGRPPLDEQTLLQSAERTRQELLAGLARRVSQHLSLPFLPATNPSLAKVHNLYSSAFTNLTLVPEVKTLADNDRLCKVVAQMVEEHRDNIPLLAKGFKESRKYLPDATITDFLDRAIRNRISLRLIAEQHLSLSAASLPFLRPHAPTIHPPPSDNDAARDPRIEPSARPPSSSLSASRVSVLDLALNPHDLISTCCEYVSLLCEATYGVSPNFRIEADPAMTVGSVGSHLEYICTELLKNAFRATIEHNVPKKEEDDPDVFKFDDLPHAHMMKDDFPEVLITIGTVPGAMTIRIRDRGGGVRESALLLQSHAMRGGGALVVSIHVVDEEPITDLETFHTAPENIRNVFSYAFTSVPNLPDPDSDPDSPATYGGVSNAGYLGGVGGGPEGAESALTTNVGTLAGLGFGLPLSRIYAGYFGGSLDLVSMYGWGTDVYCVIKTV
ncbi:Pyruvate dehydrogenase kinase [Rhodotorula toruloides ATCC 204091]|uniref:Protein-serine/threonine kinase n=1 Tax=Rhodotorula toruloides TaxID=5286 RepID=A0A0K3CHW4_RHOTO|nr:Pyruvate dehydrogenase kinase [Rhodotorula toruloides ATCC 204091]PRQ74939.1 pyruvate dehydrogenase kinase [Rhodotorula toruloides]